MWLRSPVTRKPEALGGLRALTCGSETTFAPSGCWKVSGDTVFSPVEQKETNVMICHCACSVHPEESNGDSRLFQQQSSWSSEPKAPSMSH